jgi:hypothetical protein
MGFYRRIRDGTASRLLQVKEAKDAQWTEGRAVPGAAPDATSVRLPNPMGQQASCLQGWMKLLHRLCQLLCRRGLQNCGRPSLVCFCCEHVSLSAIIVGSLQVPHPSL